MQQFPPRVVIREVGLRDGLQSIRTVLPTERKIEWIRGAYDAGQREIEVGSFVPAHLLPQLADTAELVAFAKTLPELTVSVLVPNLKGAQAALDSQAQLMLLLGGLAGKALAAALDGAAAPVEHRRRDVSDRLLPVIAFARMLRLAVFEPPHQPQEQARITDRIERRPNG